MAVIGGLKERSDMVIVMDPKNGAQRRVLQFRDCRKVIERTATLSCRYVGFDVHICKELHTNVLLPWSQE